LDPGNERAVTNLEYAREALAAQRVQAPAAQAPAPAMAEAAPRRQPRPPRQPRRRQQQQSETVRSIAMGFDHTVAIRADGSLWSWGDNSNGRTGLGITLGYITSPTRIGTDTNWAAVDKSQKTAIMATKAPVFTLGKSS